jgi:glucose-1-phosphatase
LDKVASFFYFDLGNVLAHFSHERECQQLAAVLGVTAGEVREAVFDSDLQARYETGLISTSEFCQELNRRFHTSAPVPQLVEAVSDIFWLNDDIFPLIEGVRRSGMRTGILSNTCVAHWEFLAHGLLARHLDLFDTVVLSFEQQVMKPHRLIYERAADHARTPPAEILFVDDRIDNVEGARAAGFDAKLYSSVEQLKTDLETEGIL